MALGDVVIFDEAMEYTHDGDWASTDDIWCAIVDNTVAPTEAQATPALADFTQVGIAGSYATGGLILATWGAMISEAGGILTFDTAVNPSWIQNALNDVDAYWGIVYNTTQVGDPAIAYVDLAGPADMSAGTLTITWNANGIYRITKA